MPRTAIAAAAVAFLFLLPIGANAGMAGGGPGFGNKIALINIDSEITDTTHILELLNIFGNMPNVKVIILRVNSPGGGVAASQEVFEKIIKLREKGKKFVVSMTDVAASGAYYISAAADKIYANPGTITGSIGVIVNYANAKKLLDKIGLEFVTIKSGKFKDIGSPERATTLEEKKLLESLIGDVLNQFVDDVISQRMDKIAKAANIDIKSEKERRAAVKAYMLKDVADGRIFTGKQAYNLGLVDELGNIDDAIEDAAQTAGIQGRPTVLSEQKNDKWQKFFHSMLQDLNFNEKSAIIQYILK